MTISYLTFVSLTAISILVHCGIYYFNTDITNERMQGGQCVSSIVQSWMIGLSEQTGMPDLLKVDSLAEGGQADK